MTEQLVGTIKKHNYSQHTVFLCPELSSDLKTGDQISVIFGQEKTEARITRTKSKHTVALSANIWEKLSVPFSQKVHFSLTNNTLQIGPLVGLFTTGVHPHPQHPVGRRTKQVYQYLSVKKSTPAFYFVFGPEDISYTNRRIYGHFFHHNGKGVIWRRYSVPFPNVAFDRIPNRTSENMSNVAKGKSILDKFGVKIFNPGFFNKWTIHQKIQNREDIKSYIPETIIKPNKEQLVPLFRKYRTVYLKPACGSLGLGILKLSHHPEQGILARYRGGNQNQLKRFANISSALKYFFDKKSLARYIAQQGIQLIKINDRSIDFRVHTNKDKSGQWQLTAVAAKVAGRGSVTTHMRTGGRVLFYLDVIRHCFSSDQQSKVLKKLEAASLTLSKAIDESLPGYIGELGFDIGIDQSGHPWMFEANSKPGRHVFVHNSMKQSDYLTRKMILDYSLYLADFTPKEVTS
jgi:hypothetical protein